VTPATAPEPSPLPPRRGSDRVELLGTELDLLTLNGTVDAIFNLIERGDRGWLCTVNVAILMMMRDNAFLRGFVERAAFNVADGMPLVWATRLRGPRLPGRVTGVDLIDVLCERAAATGRSVYLLGAKQEIVDKVAARLTEKHPSLAISGVADGYFCEEEATERARAVAESGAAILIVGMGVPRQERFISEHWDTLAVPFAMGVGGSFDVLSGLRSRAPLWVQDIGFEWAYRLIQEPRRLFMRYLVTNTRFLWLWFLELLSRRRSRTDVTVHRTTNSLHDP
jgi:N-acetylglucosaminyldiphosphoundecaprenol N-acetyl-beta-D-mannosaminyltransferase